MVFTSALMTFIAYIFLRNQLTPITRLSLAAEAFGKGQTLPYSPRGATEVRAAGNAFLNMRARIERPAAPAEAEGAARAAEAVFAHFLRLADAAQAGAGVGEALPA